MATIHLEDEGNMSLLGLMVRSVLEERGKSPGGDKRLESISGTANIQAGEMRVNVTFARGEIVIRKGASDSAGAGISGRLDAFIDMMLGRRILMDLVEGGIRASGDPILLLKLARFFMPAF